MRHAGKGRDSGSVLVVTAVSLAILFAVAGGMTTLTVVNLRSAAASKLGMRLFYLADSGAQIGNAMLRASGGLMDETSFAHTIDDGAAHVEITPVSFSIYRISSTGRLEGEETTVEILVEFTGSFGLEGGFEVTVGRGVEIEGVGIPVELRGQAKVSGLDHAADGQPAENQDNAVYGISMNAVPGNKDFQLTTRGTAAVEGLPETTSNDIQGHAAAWRSLRLHARQNADVIVHGSKTLRNGADGVYGTADDQKLVYARLGEENTLTLTEDFSGYGTLVIDSGEAEEAPVLRMDGGATWHGLIVVVVHDEAEVEGGALIDLRGDASVVGGMALHLDAEEVEVEDAGKILRATGDSSILYSSELVENSKGLEAVTERSARITSYSVE